MYPSPEIEQLTLHSLEALTRGDAAFFDRHISRDGSAIAIGADPDEWWVGHDEILEVAREQSEALEASSVAWSDIKAYSTGAAGWSAGRFTMRFPNGLEIPLRLTTVWHKDAPGWRLVQWHISIGYLEDRVANA